MSIVIWIHAGLDAVRTPWICTPRRYEKICEFLGYFMYGPDNVVVLTFELDESPPQRAKGGVVSTSLCSNTAKDDLEFELLLCLARILGVIERLEPICASETQSPGVFVPTHPNSNATKDDLEFEWLLCLSSTLEAIRRRWPTDVGETRRAGRFVGTEDGKFFEGESKKVLNFTRGKWQSRTQEPAFSSIDAAARTDQ
jgi:hypothetical protein